MHANLAQSTASCSSIQEPACNLRQDISWAGKNEISASFFLHHYKLIETGTRKYPHSYSGMIWILRLLHAKTNVTTISMTNVTDTSKNTLTGLFYSNLVTRSTYTCCVTAWTNFANYIVHLFVIFQIYLLTERDCGATYVMVSVDENSFQIFAANPLETIKYHWIAQSMKQHTENSLTYQGLLNTYDLWCWLVQYIFW